MVGNESEDPNKNNILSPTNILEEFKINPNDDTTGSKKCGQPQTKAAKSNSKSPGGKLF